jgi:hypothetical protein
MSSLLRVCFYLIMTILYSVAVYNDQSIFMNNGFEKVGLTHHKSFGKRFKFLTYIDLVIFFLSPSVKNRFFKTKL